MFISSLHKYIHDILIRIPLEHWAIMGIMSMALMIFILLRKKCSAYGAISLGITAFVGLFFLETAVLIRFCGFMPHTSGHSFTVQIGQLFRGSRIRRIELLSNITVFIPFGFFLSEFLASTKQFRFWHRIGFAILATFGLSLCIECLQLILHVGYFELTDLVLNTVGGGIGAGVSFLFTRFLRSRPLEQNDIALQQPLA